MKNSPETLAKRNALKRKWMQTTSKDAFPIYIDKRCKDCALVKPCKFQSSFTQTGAPEYRARCDACYAVYVRSIGQRDQSKTLRNVARSKWKATRKRKAVALLGGKCAICGYHKSLAALTFHHRDSEQKEIDLGVALSNRSWAFILKELAKCQLLCFNCHMELWEVDIQQVKC